jgi:Carboxypeptidase regulatory-like domain
MRSEKARGSVSSASFWKVCSCLLLMVAWCNSARAQTNRATITGTVTDQSGAVIAGVEVTARNVGTNLETKGITNGDGIYLVPNLPPGIYALTFRKDRFKKIEQPSITLESTQVAGISVVMQLGEATEKVVVTTDAPVLDHENATIGTNMKGDVVTDLPISIYNGGRHIEDFAKALTPGYAIYSNAYNAVINGGQYYTKDYTVDGTSATASIGGDSLETGPGMEAIEELQAQTSGLDAQSSITSGGVIAFNLKSGTNKLHGSAFGYGQNEFFNANDWNNNNLGLPRGRRRAWDYGGSLGGPIIKEKTFFFGTFERYTQTDYRLGDFSSFVPTSDFLGGNFSSLLGSNLCTDSKGNAGVCGQSSGSGGTFSNAISVKNDAGQTVPVQVGMIFDPKTGNQFTGNMVPTTSFSSVAQKIIAIYQKDYAPGRGGINTPNNRGLINSTPAQTPNQAVIKLDHKLTEKDRLSGSWVYSHRPRTLVDSGGIWEAGTTDGGPLSAAGFQLVRSDGWRVSESHIFSPTLLNVLNLTYNWYWNGKIPTASGTNWNSQLGFGNTGSNNFPFINFGGVPTAVNAQGVTFIGSGSGTGPNNSSAFQGNFTGATIITGDTVTWNRGRHTFSFGGDFHAYQVNSHTGSGALGFNFTSDTTGAPTTPYGPFVGYGFASFLLGDVNNGSASTAFDLYGRRKATSLFAQDSYKVTPKLTINLGLRWQYIWRYHEKNGHWANFDLNTIDPVLGIPGTLEYATNGADSFESKEYDKDFGPQVGFAYSPWNKWVFRGSFGILYVPAQEPYFSGVPNGFAPGFQGTNTANTPFNWDSGYAGVFQAGSRNHSAADLFPLVSIDPHALLAGYSDAFNFGAQYEVTPNMRIEVAYVGNRGHHLPDTALAWNEPSASKFFDILSKNPGINDFSDYIFCSTKGAPVPTDLGNNPIFGITCPYNNFFGSALSTIAPYPQVAAAASTTWFFYNQLYVSLPIAQSYYDSMVIDVIKRTGRGLTMDVSYTLSRQEGDSFTTQTEGNNYYTPVQDFSNLSQAAHTLTNYDQKHAVKGFVAYELPFGKGQRWLSNSGRVLNAFVSGWHVSGLFRYYSGQPFQAVVPNNYYPAWGTFYPNFNLSGFTGPSDPHKFQVPADPNNPPAVDFYIPQSVASAPAIGQLGKGPGAISALRCPGGANEDASILKYFSMGSDGQYKLSFRAEYFNLFNRHYYDINGCGGRKATIGNSNFGQIFGVNSDPRIGQFAVRLTF